MSHWLPRVLSQVGSLATDRRVWFTLKARRELAGLGLDEEDACDLLVALTAQDSVGRLKSSVTGDWMYVFKPTHGDQVLYLKLILRSDCVVISFHEDLGES